MKTMITGAVCTLLVILTLNSYSQLISSGSTVIASGAGTGGADNIFLGDGAGVNVITNGNANILLGSQCGNQLTTGDGNNMIGSSCGLNVLTGRLNNIMGSAAGYSLTTGSLNIILGQKSAFYMSTGSNNICLGEASQSEYPGTETESCVFIGSHARTTSSTTITNSVALGTNATVNQDNSIVLGDIGQSMRVGIGTDVPSAQFHTTGDVMFTGLNGGTGEIVMRDPSGYLVVGGAPLTTNCTSDNYVMRYNSGALDCGSLRDDGSHASVNAAPGGTYNNTTTAMTSGSPVFNSTVTFDVNGMTRTNSLVVLSDRKFKQNIQPIDHCLDKVMSLRGVSYRWKQNTGKQLDNTAQLGFIAQELEKVLPESVIIDNEGNYAVNYNMIIPVLTGAIQDVNNKNESLEKEIAILRKSLEDLQLNGTTMSQQEAKSDNASAFELGLNNPNPFNGTTTISYKVSGNYSKANIIIYDMSGAEIRNFPINNTKGQIIVTGSDLSYGMYMYSLIVDGKEMSTHKMIHANQ